MASSRPRVLLLWHSLAGYMAAGIRALADRSDVTVVARPPDPDAPYDYSALDLNSAELRVAKWPRSFSLVDELIERTRRDIVCGIDRNGGVLRALHRARRRSGTTTVLVADYIWSGAWRQRVLQTLFKVVRPTLSTSPSCPSEERRVRPTARLLGEDCLHRVVHARPDRASPGLRPAVAIISRIRASCSAAASFPRKPRTSSPMPIGSTARALPGLGLCESLGTAPLTADSAEYPVCK